MPGFAALLGLGILLLLPLATARAADILAGTAAPVEIAAAPVRLSLVRVAGRDGAPAALVLSEIEIRRRGPATYNVFLALSPAAPAYVGTFGLFDLGPGSAVTLPIPPPLQAGLGTAAPVIEIVPVGVAGSSFTLGRASLVGP